MRDYGAAGVVDQIEPVVCSYEDRPGATPGQPGHSAGRETGAAVPPPLPRIRLYETVLRRGGQHPGLIQSTDVRNETDLGVEGDPETPTGLVRLDSDNPVRRADPGGVAGGIDVLAQPERPVEGRIERAGTARGIEHFQAKVGADPDRALRVHPDASQAVALQAPAAVPGINEAPVEAAQAHRGGKPQSRRLIHGQAVDLVGAEAPRAVQGVEGRALDADTLWSECGGH